jgi:hypothetical protein
MNTGQPDTALAPLWDNPLPVMPMGVCRHRSGQHRREAMANDSNSSGKKTPRGLSCSSAYKGGIVYSVLLHIHRVVITPLRQRRGAAGYGMGTTIKYLRRTTSSVAGTPRSSTYDAPSSICDANRRRRQRSGHHVQGPAARNERRCGERHEPMIGPTPHTNGLRSVSRCGALSLQQNSLHYRGVRQK